VSDRLGCVSYAAPTVHETSGVRVAAVAAGGPEVARFAVACPAAGVSLPRARQPEKRFLTHQQIADLAEACGPEYQVMVLFLGYTGLRWGEMAALRVQRLDFLRRRALVAESVTPVRGVMTFGPTKGHERREVPLPRFLLDDLAQHVAGKAPDNLVYRFARRGSALSRLPTWRAQPSLRAAGHPTPHAARATPHRGLAGYRLGRGHQGRPTDARPQVRDYDARSIRPPVRRSAGRCGRRNGRRAQLSARWWVPIGTHGEVVKLRH
jgi:integrase